MHRRLAHLTTVAPGGRPHTTTAWVELDGGDIVIEELRSDQKVANVRRDPRVSISIEAQAEHYDIQGSRQDGIRSEV